MKKSISLFLMILCAVAWAYPVKAEPDRFLKTVELLGSRDCQEFNFEVVIVSDIFDTRDTTLGKAVITSDGRYQLLIGDDEYLYDLKYYYSYSPYNEQVIIEQGEQVGSGDITFITKLDSLYKATAITQGSKYQLIKYKEVANDYPDTLIVTLADSSYRIAIIEYKDINDELNVITITNEKVLPECPDALFEDHFPADMERVKLF